MIQLCFNDDFTRIVESNNNTLWKTKEDIPLEVIKYIKSKSDELPIYTELFNDDGIFIIHYCQKCFQKLDENGYCNKCSIDYKNRLSGGIYIDDIENIYTYPMEIYYYYFDIVGIDIILYRIKESILFNPKISEIVIANTFIVKNNGLYDINNEEFYDYYGRDIFLDFYSPSGSYVYPYNLEILKDTMYKYSFIWYGKNYLENNPISPFSITREPLNNKNFEYCMKNKLYKLGFTLSIKNEITFNKKYLPFLKQNDLSTDEYITLTICGIYDVNFIKELDKIYCMFDIDENKTKFNIIKEYFDNNNIKYNLLYKYFDYLEYASKLGYNLQDKKILYPVDLKKEYDKLVKQLEVINNKKNNKKIKLLSTILEINNYEDDKYIIYPAHSVEELIEESKMQNNCVKEYIEQYGNNKTQIYLMRKKEDPTKSFVTIEVFKGKIEQAKLKNNKDITQDIDLILKKWEKTITRVI